MLPARLRAFFAPACLASLGVLLASFQLESSLGLLPCPLCLSQRLLLGVYALICFAAAVHGPGVRGTLRYARLALASATAGVFLAARHVWLQGADNFFDECPMSIWGLLDSPWDEAASQLLLGGPDCSAMTWSFLDLTLPEWSMLAFLCLAALPLICLLAYRFRTLGRI
ncbi:disulfide bond formation protein B [Pseudomonas sp. PSKL.D1]|uniref:disulfide bond formation protein B n=1 Tax=Pseudomonas sp. PSKL.D1 TaxID=3029060 RepID=UPI002381089C|nr:disulfide bond formation protein B [Pseudomonas sp. PSKL.D1]WDY57847.1 disulfide bond formation protein B [Pseudomonas sp. PSKL.D1]